MKDKSNLPINLLLAVEKSKFTKEEFASLIDISVRTLYHYFSGTKFPNLNTLIKISNTLNISIDSLLEKEVTYSNLKNK